ncbi:enoyl-CoA hydratase [Ferrovibrio sp.]|uniref:enoyl-CoA hydratase n=1 Tax=Ferrovibrio sp. TaxID=1917215 RepID=UPI003D1417BF
MSDILSEIRDGVKVITLNRPDKKNALTLAMYDGLAQALRAGDADPAVRAMVLTGAGGSFTSGNDLKDFLNNAPRGDDRPSLRFLKAISEAEKPLLAAVRGPAVGVGSTMLLHCDLVYAAPSARFNFTFTNLALVPEAASTMLLPRLVGHQKAAELFLLAEAFDAAAAKEIGMVNAVLPEDEVLDFTMAQAAKLARKAPNALKFTKRLMKHHTGDVPGQIAAETTLFEQQLKSAEAREAMTAFFEKRAPKFS